MTNLMRGLDELFWLFSLFSMGDFGEWLGSPSVDPLVLFDVNCGRNVSPPCRILCRSLQEGAKGIQELFVFFSFSSWIGDGSSAGISTRTSLFSIGEGAVTVAGRSCCHTGASQSSLSCWLNFIFKQDFDFLIKISQEGILEVFEKKDYQ